MEVVAEFKECPDCKVDARLMQSIADEMIRLGTVPPESGGYLRVEIFSVLNPLNPVLPGASIPSARVSKDMCMKCGKEFTVRIEKGHMKIPIIQGQAAEFL